MTSASWPWRYEYSLAAPATRASSSSARLSKGGWFLRKSATWELRGSTLIQDQIDRQVARPALNAIRLVRPGEVRYQAMTGRVCPHHDRVAVQPAGLLHDPLRAGTRADHPAVRVDALAPQPSHRLVDHLALPVPLRLRGQKARVGEPEGRAPHPGDREHVHRSVRLLRDACRQVHRRHRDLALLRREEHRPHVQRGGIRWRAPRSKPGDHFDGTTPGGTETSGCCGCCRLSSIRVL